MKLFRKSKPRLRAVLLALIIVVGGIPFVVGSHVNDMLSPWRSLEDDPTGNNLLDDALATAASTLDSTLEDERIPRRDEPQVPATFFHDIFDPEDRIGGWGDWRPDDVGAPGYSGFGGWTQETRWNLDPSAAGRTVQVPWVTPVGNRDLQTKSYDIDQGYRFGDETGYPLPDLTPPSPAYSFLASPLISLQSLPVRLPDERAEVPASDNVDQAINADGNGTVDLTQQAAGARFSLDGHLDHQDRIILYMDHKYHFAQSQATTDRGGVFLLDAQGNFISGYLQPLRASTTFSGFSGAQLEFTEEAFDLSPWAGQDVRIVFEAATGGLDGFTKEQYFGDANKFTAGADFFGWAISNVRVEGPAHMHNVRLDRITYPTHQAGGDALAARPGTEPMKLLLLNKGRVTEEVSVQMDVDGGACAEVTVRGLRPGEAFEVAFAQEDLVPQGTRNGCPDGLDIQDGEQYELEFRVELLTSGRADLYPTDNLLAASVVGQGPDVRSAARMNIDPALASPGDQVTIALAMENRGVADVDVRTELRIDRRHPSAADFTEVDVHDDPTLVRFNNDRQQDVLVPGRQQTNAVWQARFQEAGLYRLTATVTAPDGSHLFAKSAIVGILMAPEFAYNTQFDSSGGFDDDTVVAGEWDGVQLGGEVPPCRQEPDGTCTDYEEVWELRNHKAIDSDPPGFAPGTTDALRAEFRAEDWEGRQQDLAVPIEAVEVKFLHYARDIRCQAPGNPNFQITGCDVPLRFSNTQTWPGNRLSVRLVEGVASAAELPTEVRDHEIQHVGGSHYRNAYFTGQWISETHRIPIKDLLDGTDHGSGSRVVHVPGEGELPVESFPLARLLDFALEFRHQSADMCIAFSAKNTACPLWRVAEASVRGVPADGGSPIPVLQWSGADEEEQQGTWFSYAYPRGPLGPDNRGIAPFCMNEDTNERAEDNQQRCPVWSVRQITSIAADAVDATTWTESTALNAWTHAVKQTDGVYAYQEQEGGIVDRLQSPVFRVPDADEPSMAFEHRFQLQPYTPGGRPGWSSTPSFADSGMLMVRFFDEDGTSAVSPLLPVYLDGGRFMRDDCKHYYGSRGTFVHPRPHPDQEFGCPDGLLQRSSARESFNLANFPLLDYRDPDTTLADPPVIRGSGGGGLCGDGYGLDENGVPREKGDSSDGRCVPGDVAGAFQRVDLRRCTSDGQPVPVGQELEGGRPCTVQFVFQLEIPDPVPRSTLDLIEDKTNQRFSLQGVPGAAEGWFVEAFRIVKDDVRDFDLELLEAQVSADYDWESMDLGPGTSATAQLRVRNNGVFTVDDALFHVTVQDSAFPDDDHTWRYKVRADPEFVLQTDEETLVNVTFRLPEKDGHYRIAFGVDVVGDLIPDQVALLDMVQANNCRYLQIDQGGQRTGPLPSCDVANSGHVPVISHPVLGIDLQVSPQVGRTGEEFPREVNLRVNNTGNVVVKNAVLSLHIALAGGSEPPKVHQWIIEESPAPGLSQAWTSMRLRDPSDPSRTLPALARIALEDGGTSFLTAFIEPSAADRAEGHDWIVSQQVRLDAFNTIYSDTFESRGVSIDREFQRLVGGEGMIARNASWQNVATKAPDADGDMQNTRAWRFGDPGTGKYPDHADATLELPPIDLSSARRAILSLSHNYDLENGYDGARVEASLDGKQWIPLEPNLVNGGRGYPTEVSADSPLNHGNDPTVGTPAFTGNSLDRNALTDGWVIDEFDLAQLPNFTTPLQLERLNQLGFEDSGPHVDNAPVARPDGGSVTYHEDWSLPQTTCSGALETCWSRDNLNWGNPVAREPDGFWWTGSVGDLTRPSMSTQQTGWKHPGTGMQLDFTVPALADDEAVRVAFSYWKDESGKLYVDRGPGTPLVQYPGATNGWVADIIPISVNELNDGGMTDMSVRLRFEAEVCQFSLPPFPRGCVNNVDKPNRGAALEYVRLEIYRLDSAGQPDIVSSKSMDLLRGGHVGDAEMHLTPFVRLNNVDSLVDKDLEEFCDEPGERFNFTELCRKVDGAWVSDFAWSAVDEVPATPEAWGIDPAQRTRRGDFAPVWRFGSEYAPLDDPGRFSYPGNAHEQLVTPRLDLQGVAGESATFTSWWKYEIMPNHERRVLIQVIEPTPEGGERVGEWEELLSLQSSSAAQSLPTGEGCTDDLRAWCPVELDISEYIGQVVRFAFEIKTPRLTLGPGTPENRPIGWTWMIDEVGIQAESLVGEPVQLRLRAATDGSINEGFWMVENVQLVGLPYKANVAVLPDQKIEDLRLAAGEEIELTGFVRNVGLDAHLGAFLNLEAAATDNGGPTAPAPEILFLRGADGELLPGDGATGPIGPINLPAAGTPSPTTGEIIDRIPFAIRVVLPEDAPLNTDYSFKLSLLEEAGGAVVEDDNIGDHHREFLVSIKAGSGFKNTGFAVDPPTLATITETADFSLKLENTGTSGITGKITVQATRLDVDGEPIEVDELSIEEALGQALRPGRQETITWDWAPQEEGFYRITAQVAPDGMAPRDFYTHVLVGSLPLYYVDDFSTDPFNRPGAAMWSRTPPAQCMETATNCWRQSTVFHEHGDASIFVGNDQAGAKSYGAANTQAQTPALDLSFLAKDASAGENGIRTGASPFKPYLSMRYQPMLAGNDGVTVQGRLGDTGGYSELRTGVLPLTGRDNAMRVASFPLFDAQNRVLDQGTPLLGNDVVSFQFDTGNWAQGPKDGLGFALDHVTVSSYDVDVDPPRHDIDLRLGSDKVFYFKVENTGAANDTYSVAIDPEATSQIFQSALVTAEVLTPEISLEPGGSELAEVRVTIPFQRLPDLFTGTEIVVTVTSGVDPNRVATGTIAVDRFIEADLADLVTDLRRPRGESGPVVEGEQATFIVSVTNTGDRASRATDLVVFACPTQLLDDDGKKIKDVSLKECGDTGLATQIGAVPLPPLTAAKDAGPESTDHVSTRTFSWVPPLGSRGVYQVVAVADPRQIVVQFDRSSSIDKEDLTVAPIERPDLVVTGLRVTDSKGNEVRQAFAGETLHIQGTVENLGHAPAPNVKVRIVNQFNLRDERIGDLNPGATRTMSAQWIAQPGNWVILFGATTAAVEIDSDNNAKRWSLAVRSGTLQAQWDPQILHLDPGESSQAVLRIDNRRDSAVDLVASATADGLSVQGVPGSIELARGASTQVSVLVTASPFAQGRHTVDVELVQKDTGATLATSMLEVHVGAQRGVRVAAEPLFAPPGTARLPLTFTNTGTAPEAFTVRLEAPETWTATVLQPTLRLAPDASRTVDALIEIPVGTPAGRYQVFVEGGDVVEAVAWIDVVEQPVWRSVVMSVHSLGDHVEVMVRVDNIGNAKASPPFLLDGTVLHDVQPAPTAQEPGESRTYRLRVDGDSEVVLPGQDDEVPLELRPQRPPVEATRFEVQSSGLVRSGGFVTMHLQVRGDDSQVQLPVHLLVDGVRLTGERIDLEADETRDVMLTWQVEKAGKRVVTAVMGSGDATVARTIVLDVEHASDARIPGPGPVFILALIAMVAVLRRRRDA